MGDKTVSFEEAIAQLETIVGKLESGDVPLEKAIELFQEGMKLSSICTQKLDQVEKKIEVLIEAEQGELIKQPFHPIGENEDDSE